LGDDRESVDHATDGEAAMRWNEETFRGVEAIAVVVAIVVILIAYVLSKVM
jgi:hypothetical protein